MTTKNKKAILVSSLICLLFIYLSLLSSSIIINSLFFKQNINTKDQKSSLERYHADKEMKLMINYDALADATKINPEITNNIWMLAGGESNSKFWGNVESGGSTYRPTDKFGFYNNNLDYDKKNKILLLGDSFGVSAGVKESDSMKKIFRHNKLNIINLSLSNKGYLSHLATLYEYGEYISPQKVILFYYEGNDFKDTKKEIQNPILKNYFFDSNFRQNLIERQNEIDNQYKQTVDTLYKKWIENKNKKISSFTKTKHKLLKILRLKALKDLVKLSIKKEYCQDNNFSKEVFNLTKIIKDIKLFTNNTLGAELLVIYLPESNSFKNKPPCHKKFFTEILNNNDIRYIDFSSEIEKSEDYLKYWQVLPSGKTAHYNPFGYKELAKFIINNI